MTAAPDQSAPDSRRGPGVRALLLALDAVAMAAFIGMLLASLGQVLFRYVLEIPVPWTEELARLLFVVSMLLGMAIAIREKEHIVVDFLLLKLSPRARAIAACLFDALILAFLLAWARGTVGLIDLNWNSYLVALNWIRVGYLYIAELGAVVLMIVFVVADLFAQARRLRPPAPAVEASGGPR